jgi:C-terminal processing protease CtpA/Prc
MKGLRVFVFTSTLLACGALPVSGQYKVDLVSAQGATIACTGIGPAASLARKCVDMFQQAGLIKESEVGDSGLTIGTTGKDDGAITSIAPDSAAAHAGLQVGDVITAVEGKPVKPTPGAIAAKAVFGKRGETLHLKLMRGGAEQEVSLVRAAKDAPEGPKSPSRMIMLRPMVDWLGDFMPCMGAGLAAQGAVEYCYSHFKSYGFIKVGDFGSTGFRVDLAGDSAIIKAVEPDSAAAQAGIQVGDVIVGVDGHPLTASTGEAAKERIFGKGGDQFHVAVRRGKNNKTFALQLTGKPNR